jgi:hypothetical protein
MSTTTTATAPATPLRRLAAWWDGVVDRINRLPRPTNLLLVVVFALFF